MICVWGGGALDKRDMVLFCSVLVHGHSLMHAPPRFLLLLPPHPTQTNRNVAYLVATGSDDGSFKVWDLRQFGAAAAATKPIAHFTWHKGALPSVRSLPCSPHWSAWLTRRSHVHPPTHPFMQAPSRRSSGTRRTSPSSPAPQRTTRCVRYLTLPCPYSTIFACR